MKTEKTLARLSDFINEYGDLLLPTEVWEVLYEYAEAVTGVRGGNKQ